MPINKPVAKAEYTHQIDKYISDYLEKKAVQANGLSPYYQELWRDIARLIKSGGKRLRPRITLLSYSILGGKDPQAILPAAAAVELLHLGMLIHDDIIDRDTLRYGVDNIVGSYYKNYASLVGSEADRLHYSQSMALLAGDLMISESYQMLLGAKVDAAKLIEVQKLFGQSIFEVIGGELLDTEAVFRGSEAVTAEQIALYKTASYTFILPMLIGAKLADVTAANQLFVRTLAHNLGIAYQLKDDIIGVFGDQATTGKTNLGDIREGKRTFLVEQFYILSSEKERAAFNRYFGNKKLKGQELSVVREMLMSSAALEKTEHAINDYINNARAALSHLKVDPIYLDEIESLIDIVINRKK